MAHEFDHGFTLADVLSYAGCEFNKICRNAQMLKETANDLIYLAEVKGFTAWLAAGRTYLGEGLMLLGSVAEGLSMMRQGFHEELSVGVHCSLPGSLRYLAEAYCKLGEQEQTESVLSWAFNMMEQNSDHHWEAEMHRMQAAAHLMQSHAEEAEASLKQGIQVARRQQARMWELRVAIDLAHLWGSQGRTDEAQRMLHEIYSWFTEGFDTPELSEAREFLSGIPV
jgi:predicted ATPase